MQRPTEPDPTIPEERRGLQTALFVAVNEMVKPLPEVELVHLIRAGMDPMRTLLPRQMKAVDAAQAWAERMNLTPAEFMSWVRAANDIIGALSFEALGADHGDFHLKAQVVEQVRQAGHQVEDVGAHTHDPQDDYPDFA